MSPSTGYLLFVDMGTRGSLERTGQLDSQIVAL